MRGLLLALLLLSAPAVAQIGSQPGPGPCPFGASSCQTQATGSTTQRTLAARAADVVNVKDYGAVCDGSTDDTTAIQAAFTAAASASTGITLTFPVGQCLISSQVSQSIGASHGIRVRGSGGLSGILSANGSGVDITLTSTTSMFDISDIAFMRTAAGGALGTGLAVTATVSGKLTNNHFDNLTFGAVTRSVGSWQVGLHLTSLNGPVIDGAIIALPDGTNATTDIGVQLSGTDTSHFLTDAKISNTIIQGGHAGVSVDTAVQGVFFTNSEAVGNDYGIYAEDTTSFTYSQEAVIVSNSHFNNLIAGIYLHRMQENQITGSLFLHFNPLVTRAWNAILIDTAGYTTVTGNTLLGAGVNPEHFVTITGGQQLYNISGNNIITLAGICIDASGGTNAMIVGNSCQGVTGAGAITLGTTSYAGNNIVNGAAVIVGTGSVDASLVWTGTGAMTKNQATVTTFSVNNSDASGRSSLAAVGETSKGAYLQSNSSTAGVTGWRSGGVVATDWQKLILSAFNANSEIQFQTGSTNTSGIHMKLDTPGHLSFLGTVPAVATGAGDCGTSPAIVGNDSVGRITVGSSTNGGKCTVTFANAWTTNAPVCRASNETTSNLIRPASASTTTVAFTGTLTAGDVLSYSCVQYQ